MRRPAVSSSPSDAQSQSSIRDAAGRTSTRPDRPDDIRIRRLATGDAHDLAVFYNGLSHASKRTFRPLGQTTTRSTCDEIVLDNMADRDTRMDLVAWHNGQIVGWCFIWELDSAAPTFGLAVSDAYHGRGLGTRLMGAVMDWAKQQRLQQVDLTVVQDNLVAQHIYSRFGFVRTDEFTGDDGLRYWRMSARP